MNPNQSADNLTPIYNPDSDDFTITYDIFGTSQPVEFIAYAKEVTRFPQVVAKHIAKHLAHKLVGKRGTYKSNYEDEYKKIINQITEVQNG